MKVMNIIQDSIVDGEGLRSVIFLSGCKWQCRGCHNPSSWNMNNGFDLTINEIVQRLDNPINEVTISGGDPFLQAKELVELLKILKLKGKNIWCYTGYSYEELLKKKIHRDCLSYINILVDGKFEIGKRDLSLLYRGSANQRIIDVQQSLAQDTVVLWKDGNY